MGGLRLFEEGTYPHTQRAHAVAALRISCLGRGRGHGQPLPLHVQLRRRIMIRSICVGVLSTKAKGHNGGLGVRPWPSECPGGWWHGSAATTGCPRREDPNHAVQEQTQRLSEQTGAGTAVVMVTDGPTAGPMMVLTSSCKKHHIPPARLQRSQAPSLVSLSMRFPTLALPTTLQLCLPVVVVSM